MARFSSKISKRYTKMSRKMKNKENYYCSEEGVPFKGEDNNFKKALYMRIFSVEIFAKHKS